VHNSVELFSVSVAQNDRGQENYHRHPCPFDLRLDNSCRPIVLAVVEGNTPVPQPYIIPKLAGTSLLAGPNVVYRFPVTGNSSGGAFTLLTTDSPALPGSGVFLHTHRIHHENFYCSKGRCALWAATNATGDNARIMTAGDYGAVPQNMTHTFQLIDPDTMLTGVIAPGGFEKLFFFMGQPYESSTDSPFPPLTNANGSVVDKDPPPPHPVDGLEGFDVYASPSYTPRTDFENGTAPATAPWHNAPNTLPSDTKTPYFIAKNWGPKFLNKAAGFYQIVTPLATSKTSGGLFSEGTLTISPLFANVAASSLPMLNLTQPLAFMMEEGAMMVEVEGYEGAEMLVERDVLFVPKHTGFKYWAARPFTKALYVTGGDGGLDGVLIDGGVEWDSASYPSS